VVLVVAGVVAIAFAATLMFIRRSEKDLMEHKTARTTVGTVVDKGRVQFKSDQTTYQNDEGQTVHLEDWRKESGELRILYSIENFDQLPAPNRAALAAAEHARAKRLGSRFRVVDQHTFDEAKIGQAVNVTYRWADDSQIEVISFELTGQPGKEKLRQNPRAVIGFNG
jgi:hypothetical protein